jgi:hypothetical protein
MTGLHIMEGFVCCVDDVFGIFEYLLSVGFVDSGKPTHVFAASVKFMWQHCSLKGLWIVLQFHSSFFCHQGLGATSG